MAKGSLKILNILEIPCCGLWPGMLKLALRLHSQEFKCPPAGEPGGYLCHMNVADPDEIWKKAMASGATQIAELKTHFWGDYYGSFKDPYGFEWAVMKA